jgi:hypothetical protein
MLVVAINLVLINSKVMFIFLVYVLKIKLILIVLKILFSG